MRQGARLLRLKKKHTLRDIRAGATQEILYFPSKHFRKIDVVRVQHLLGHLLSASPSITAHSYLGNALAVNTFRDRILASFFTKAPEPVPPLVANAPGGELPAIDGVDYPLIDPLLLVILIWTVL